MKKTLYILVLVLVSFISLSSCDSYFDVSLNDQATLEETFEKSTTTLKYLRHCYSYIPYDERVRDEDGGVMMRSDEVLFGSSSYPTPWYAYRRGDYGPSIAVNRASGNSWATYYKAINQCTTFLQYYHLDKEDNETVKKAMAAEARFLRAYYYFCLFRWYGPVYVWGDKPANENILGAEVDRHSVETVVNFIVSELDKAANDLPVQISEIAAEKGNTGRATKGAALALKSRVLLYAASPLYNGCELYKGMKNYYGDFLFPQEYDGEKWQLAADAAWDVIKMNEYELCSAPTATGDAFKDGAAAYQQILFKPWNTETIWGWWYRTINDWEGGAGSLLAFSLPEKIAGYCYSLLTPSLKLIDAYPMWESGRYPVKGYLKNSDGLDLSKPVIDDQSGYEAEGFTDDYQQIIDVDPSWATPIKAHNSVVGRDPRFYACFVPNGFWWVNDQTYDMAKNATTGPQKVRLNEWYQSAGNINRVGFVWRRLYKPGNPLLKSDYAPIKYVYPAFRLAEIYLNYAEACNEKPQRDEAAAIEYLNKVRNRAGLKNIEDAYPGEINQESLRWFIRQEKMVEFAMEGHRWYDLTRTMTAKEEIPAGAWTLSLDKTTDYEASWERTDKLHSDGPIVFQDRDYLFPLGTAQLSEMTNITQNYGF